jgi:C2 domain
VRPKLGQEVVGNGSSQGIVAARATSSDSMKKRTEHRAIVTIQAANISGYDFAMRPNTKVRILVMVPKGKHNVTVPTNCNTFIKSSSREPVWNQSFSIPVHRESDVLVFQLLDCKVASIGKSLGKLHNKFAVQQHQNSRISGEAPNDSQEGADGRGLSSSFHAAIGASRDWGAESQVNGDDPHHSASLLSQKRDGVVLGACMFPVVHLPESGDVIHRVLEIFESATLDSPSAGTLYIATKLVTTQVNVLEKSDLHADLLSQYHRSRLSAFQDRFLGIGELAAFLHEEAFSTDVEANWDRAVTILAEQLAYRIYETTDSTADRQNFATAKARILEDGGLWDGM